MDKMPLLLIYISLIHLLLLFKQTMIQTEKNIALPISSQEDLA